MSVWEADFVVCFLTDASTSSEIILSCFFLVLFLYVWFVRVIYWWPFLGIPAVPLVPGKWSVPQRDIFRSCEAAVSVSACTHNPAFCWLKNVVRLKMQSASASVGLSSRLHRCNRREVCVITAAMGTVLNLLSHKVCDWSHQQSSSVFVCVSLTQHWVMLVLSFMLHRGAAAARSPTRGVVDPGVSARSLCSVITAHVWTNAK